MLMDERGQIDIARAAVLAGQLADESGRILRRWFRQPIGVETKHDNSPVTRADREAEAAIRGMLARVVPGHAVLGEEMGASGAADGAAARFRWVIDPIDGTKAFISGKPLFGTLIALLDGATPILGLIDQPIVGDRWIGGERLQALHNGRPCTTRACPDLRRALMATTTPDMFAGADAEAFVRLKAAVGIPTFGGDCCNYALLASGFIDIVVEADLKLWDFAALAPLVLAAGGAMTDWQGRPLTAASDGRVIACGDPALLPSVVALLNS